MLTTINRCKTHYQKRAYQCIKCLVKLFTKCDVALNELKRDPEIRRNWQLAVEWLQDELERVSFYSNTKFASRTDRALEYFGNGYATRLTRIPNKSPTTH